jgi:hypothetical protein
MSDSHQFTHLFANGLTCTFVFDPELHHHPESRMIAPAKHWSRSFDDAEADAILPEYREWAHTVHGEIADILGESCVYVLQDSAATLPFWEFWVYHPGGTKECVKRGTGRFDPRMMGRDKWPP